MYEYWHQRGAIDKWEGQTGFRILTAVVRKSSVFWDIKRYGSS
jgi:hypothetical protein